jgi:hypothetical protein
MSTQTSFSPVQGDDQQRHSTAQAPSASASSEKVGDSLGTEYPPQKHAGKAGLGPHYYEQHRATFVDKVHGLREELEGQIEHDEKLQQVCPRRAGLVTLRSLLFHFISFSIFNIGYVARARTYHRRA